MRCKAARSENPRRTPRYGEGLSDEDNEADRNIQQALSLLYHLLIDECIATLNGYVCTFVALKKK